MTNPTPTIVHADPDLELRPRLYAATTHSGRILAVANAPDETTARKALQGLFDQEPDPKELEGDWVHDGRMVKCIEEDKEPPA